MSRLNRGTGTLYRPTHRASDGTIRRQAAWWMQYFVQGRCVRESTGTRNRTAAARLVATKVGRVAEGRPVPPRVDKVTYDDLAADLRRHYRTTGCRDLTEAEKRLRPLDAHCVGWLATAITPAEITRYVAQIDLPAGTVRLEPGATKNEDARVVYVTPEGTTALTAQLERVRALERRLGRIVPFVFPHLNGRRAGTRIKNFRKAWPTACRPAGCPGMLKRDFRRTAVRNLVNDGTPEKVAMTITGHKTRSVFDCYHIVAPEDLKAAAARIAAPPGSNRRGKRQGGLDSEGLLLAKLPH